MWQSRANWQFAQVYYVWCEQINCKTSFLSLSHFFIFWSVPLYEYCALFWFSLSFFGFTFLTRCYYYFNATVTRSAMPRNCILFPSEISWWIAWLFVAYTRSRPDENIEQKLAMAEGKKIKNKQASLIWRDVSGFTSFLSCSECPTGTRSSN